MRDQKWHLKNQRRRRGDQRNKYQGRFSPRAVGSPRKNPAPHKSAQPAGANNEPGGCSGSLRNLRDVQRRKGMHHEEPGHEARRPGAAELHISVSQQRQIILERRFGVVYFARVRLLYEFPNQKAKNNSGNARGKKSKAPSKSCS